MTHFVTLAYLHGFAPYLLLLLATLVHGRARSFVVAIAVATQVLIWPTVFDELFSRQLARDRYGALAFVVVASVGWWKRVDPLALFAATALGAVNDTASLFVLWAVLCRSRESNRQYVSWFLLGYLCASGVRQMGVSEFALVQQMSSPILWGGVAAVVGVALLWAKPRWVDLVAWGLPLGRMALLAAPVDGALPWVLR